MANPNLREFQLRKPVKVKQTRKAINKRTPKRAKEERIYRARVKEWLVGKACCVYPYIVANQNHHQRGRIHGLLLDERFWLPVSDAGHYLINTRPAWARKTWAELGAKDSRKLKLLCEVGQFNSIPKNNP